MKKLIILFLLSNKLSGQEICINVKINTPNVDFLFLNITLLQSNLLSLKNKNFDSEQECEKYLHILKREFDLASCLRKKVMNSLLAIKDNQLNFCLEDIVLKKGYIIFYKRKRFHSLLLTFSKQGYKTVTIPFHPMCRESIEALKHIEMEKEE